MAMITVDWRKMTPEEIQNTLNRIGFMFEVYTEEDRIDLPAHAVIELPTQEDRDDVGTGAIWNRVH